MNPNAVIELHKIVRNFQLGAEEIRVLRSIDLNIGRGEYLWFRRSKDRPSFGTGAPGDGAL